MVTQAESPPIHCDLCIRVTAQLLSKTQTKKFCKFDATLQSSIMTVNCPPEYKQYSIKENTSGVSPFFSQYKAVDWSFYNYCNFHRDVQSIAGKLKQSYYEDLLTIKKETNVPDEIKRYVGNLYDDKTNIISVIK